MNLQTATRRTRAGYFQPVLIDVASGRKLSPPDNASPAVSRAAAKRQAEYWRAESLQHGFIVRAW